MDIKIKDRTLELPIIQGGMGVGVSLGRLAGTVASFGAMGTISMVDIGFKEEDFWKKPLEANIRAYRKELAKAKEISKGKGLIAVNMMSVATDYDALIEEIMDSEADAVIVGAGLPLKLPEKNINGKLLAPIVSGKRALDLICRTWLRRFETLPDFVILEGRGAGGHLGFSLQELDDPVHNLEDLTVEVVEYLKEYEVSHGVKIPLFVAGSVMDNEDLNLYRSLGATGLQIGTRFLTTTEADAHENMKQLIVDSSSEDLVIIKSPVGIYGRAINNKLIKDLEDGRIAPSRCINCLKPCNPKTTDFCISEKLIQTANGDVGNGLVFCGSRVDEIKSIISVKEVLENVMGGNL
ncbi:NAD(P)H-dependent flavin oxidoreductase [Microaceticoccus formicicus]|uniref:NAD(P)H-dependent flavin oxidoreductase n=1 Tax=Microaceticoccus formicicus TaxID=3118105 RepID=UPI003CD04097|nr:nitronate monooxygenase family protein [Peptoniphilaceae bacterium AMB_02]